MIDLKLTSYGKYLLSIGKLNPTFYAFFDDDIIYDSSFAGVSSENQNNIEPRIQEKTPRISTQVNFSNRELAIYNTNPKIVNDLIIDSNFINQSDYYESAVEEELINVQEQPEKLEVLQKPLSFSNPDTIYAPAWNVSFIKAPLSSSANYLTVSSSHGEKILNIPQLDANISYQIIRNSRSYNILNAQGGVQKFGGPSDFVQAGAGQRTGENAFLLEERSLNFQNGASIDVVGDAIILRIEESNLFFGEENFDIELFAVRTTEASGEKEFLSQIKFYKDLGTLSEDLLNDTVLSSAAENYFDVLVDGEIPDRVICPLIKEDKSKQFYASRIFECEDFQQPPDARNLYADLDDTGEICNQ